MILGLIVFVAAMFLVAMATGKVSAALRISNRVVVFIALVSAVGLILLLNLFANFAPSILSIIFIEIAAFATALLAIYFKRRFFTPAAAFESISVKTTPSYQAGASPPHGLNPQATRHQEHKDYFVSHSSLDVTEASKLVAALERVGTTCWIAPRNIRPGETYGDAIAEAVAQSTKATLVLISANSERSASVKAELELARRFNRPIVPVILNGHSPGKGVIFYIGTSHWLPFDDGSPATIDALVNALPSEQ